MISLNWAGCSLSGLGRTRIPLSHRVDSVEMTIERGEFAVSIFGARGEYRIGKFDIGELLEKFQRSPVAIPVITAESKPGKFNDEFESRMDEFG